MHSEDSSENLPNDPSNVEEIKEQLITAGLTPEDIDTLSEADLKARFNINNIFFVKNLLEKGFTLSQLKDITENRFLILIKSNCFLTSYLMREGFSIQQLLEMNETRLAALSERINRTMILLINNTPAEIINLSDDEFNHAMGKEVIPEKQKTNNDTPQPTFSPKSTSLFYGLLAAMLLWILNFSLSITFTAGLVGTVLSMGALQWRERYKQDVLKKLNDKNDTEIKDLPEKTKDAFDVGYRAANSYCAYFGSIFKSNCYSRSFYAGMAAAEAKDDKLHDKVKYRGPIRCA